MLRNVYPILQKPDGWWLVIDEKCSSHIIGKTAQPKHIAVKHSLMCLIESLQDDIKFIDEDPAYADTLIGCGVVDVITEDKLHLGKWEVEL